MIYWTKQKICKILICAIFIPPAVSALTPKQKLQFIKFMVPKINVANKEILLARRHMAYLHFIWELGEPLSLKQQLWLQKLTTNYQIKSFNFAYNSSWINLAKRVDSLPDSLVLAQSIIESRWGRSRFAQKARNYFGKWCTAPGCGIIPKRRPKNATYEVKKYANALDSVKDYMLNLNIHKCYGELRELRYKLRKQNKILSGIVLARGLEHYSQRGKNYITIVQSLIQKYQLEKYDKKQVFLIPVDVDIDGLWWWASP